MTPSHASAHLSLSHLSAHSFYKCDKDSSAIVIVRRRGQKQAQLSRKWKKEETNVEKWEVWQIISWTSSNEDDTAMWWSRLCLGGRPPSCYRDWISPGAHLSPFNLPITQLQPKKEKREEKTKAKIDDLCGNPSDWMQHATQHDFKLLLRFNEILYSLEFTLFEVWERERRRSNNRSDNKLSADKLFLLT